MKITPDKNEDAIQYWESPDCDDGYFYEVYVLIDEKKSRIIITEEGVSIEDRSLKQFHCSCVRTNLKPNKMFPGKSHLEWDDISKILKVLEKIGCEGRTYSAQEMKAKYQEWKDLGEP